MVSTTSYIFSIDARATAFRRAVRSRVAQRHEYAVPGSGPSAHEVQRAYLRYCVEQQEQGQSDGVQQTPPPYMQSGAGQSPPTYTSSSDNQVPPPYTPSTNSQAPPPYTSTPASDMTPSAQLDILLYSNTSTPASLPEFTEAIATSPPPPSYEDVVSARTPTTNHTLSRTNMSTISAGCTTRTSRKKVQKQAIQALDLVVVSKNDRIEGTGLPPRSSRATGILRRIKDRMVA